MTAKEAVKRIESKWTESESSISTAQTVGDWRYNMMVEIIQEAIDESVVMYKNKIKEQPLPEAQLRILQLDHKALAEILARLETRVERLETLVFETKTARERCAEIAEGLYWAYQHPINSSGRVCFQAGIEIAKKIRGGEE